MTIDEATKELDGASEAYSKAILALNEAKRVEDLALTALNEAQAQLDTIVIQALTDAKKRYSTEGSRWGKEKQPATPLSPFAALEDPPGVIRK